MDRAHGGANGGGKLLYTRGEVPGRPFIGKQGEKDRHDEQGLIYGCYGGEEPQKPGGDRGAGGRRWQRAGAVARGQGASRGG
jgi:hypothetical protein